MPFAMPAGVGRPKGVDEHRRQTDFVPFLNPLFRIDPLAVDAYLALAHQPVDPAAGHGLEEPHQEIVDSLTGLIGRYGAQSHGAFGGVQAFRHCQITIHDFDIFAAQSSKVLITLTLTDCRDNVLKPCQALNHLKGHAHKFRSCMYTGFRWPPIRWGAAY